MSDLVTRLRNWRNVHLARVHLLMDEAADEMERLSKTGHCPAPESGTNPDNVWNKLAQEIACLRSDISRRANLESGLRAGVVRLQAEVRRLEVIIAASQASLTDAERLQDTPATLATPSEGSVQDGCTLTAAEREAVKSAIWDYAQNDDDEDCARMVATLERLLERME